MRRVGLVLVMICAAATTAAAESWYSGPAGRKRVLHLSVSVGGGLLVLANETLLGSRVNPTECRWCRPGSTETAVRNWVVWDDTRRADILSSIDAYVVAPIVGIGLLAISERNAKLSRFLDDTIPVVETVVLTQLFVHTLKLAFARQRPFVRFGSDVAFESEHNMSFPSGHSALGFAITTSAGMICHWRQYWTEPYVWGAGIALSLSTEYLRMAADKHYLSDVLVGGAIGVAGGLLIPRLMRADIPIVPVKNGLAIATTF